MNDNVFSLDNNPLVKHKMTLLRNKNTPNKDFREILEEITFILAVEASKNLVSQEKTVQTPIATYKGLKVKGSMIIPIIRAGIGMVNPMLKILPGCRLGFMGLSRNEKTLEPIKYYCNIPKPNKDETIFIIDPMLATGGSISYTVKYLLGHGAKKIIVVSIVSTPLGIKKVISAYKDVVIYTAEIDSELNDIGFITPGLGDAGDRIFNT